MSTTPRPPDRHDTLTQNGDEEIDIFEFTIYLLKLWGLVDDHILAAINERFKVPTHMYMD